MNRTWNHARAIYYVNLPLYSIEARMVSYKVSLISPLTLKSCLSCRASNQHLTFFPPQWSMPWSSCFAAWYHWDFIPHEIITVVVWSIIYIYIYMLCKRSMRDSCNIYIYMLHVIYVIHIYIPLYSIEARIFAICADNSVNPWHAAIAWWRHQRRIPLQVVAEMAEVAEMTIQSTFADSSSLWFT